MPIIELPEPIAFEWDKGNQAKSFVKHRITNEESEEVLLSFEHIIFEDLAHSGIEKRYVAIGLSRNTKMLTVIFTIRKNKIRIVSARPASRKERRIYEKTS